MRSDFVKSLLSDLFYRKMTEQAKYTKRQMGVIYAGLVAQSTIQMLNVLLSVFMLEGVEFVCHAENETLHSACPDDQVSKCMEIEYDRSMWTNNLIMEMDLVCDRAWMKTLPYYGP